jgi:hypothetical protein
MKRTMVLAAILALVSAATWTWTQTPSLALRFDPVLRLVSVSGQTFVLRPDEKPALDAESGQEYWPPAKNNRAYPYGTRIMTGNPASGLIKFSRFSEAEIGTNSLLTVDEEKEDARRKIIRLERGSLNVKMETGIEAHGNALTVLAPAIRCLASQYSVYNVAIRQQDDDTLTDFSLKGGDLALDHPTLFRMHLAATEKGVQQGVRVTSSPDGNFVNLTGLHGSFGVKVKNPPRDDGPPEEMALEAGFGGLAPVENAQEEIFEGLPHEEGYRIFKMTPGFTLKFSKRRTVPDNVLMVTILPIDASGNIMTNSVISYAEGMPEPPALLPDGQASDPFSIAAPPDAKAAEKKKEEAPPPIDLDDLGLDF